MDLILLEQILHKGLYVINTLICNSFMFWRIGGEFVQSNWYVFVHSPCTPLLVKFRNH